MQVMMALGEFRFSVLTAAYRELQRTAEYEWAAVDRLGRRPALQFTGPGMETINLPGVVYPTYAGGLGQVATMRAAAEAGDPLRMVDGLGRVWGLWCITAVDERQVEFLPGGIPRKQEFRLTLARYGEDSLALPAPAPLLPETPQAARQAASVSDQPSGLGAG